MTNLNLNSLLDEIKDATGPKVMNLLQSMIEKCNDKDNTIV